MCQLGGAVVAGLQTSSKGTPQRGKPWPHLLEGKTWLCLGRSCSAGFWVWAVPQAAAGQHLAVPHTATNPSGWLSPDPGTSSPPLRALGGMFLFWGVFHRVHFLAASFP